MSVAIKDITAEIAKEAALLNPLEQQLLLTKLKVKRLKRKGIAALANPLKGIREPTLKQIDKWKHESRISLKG